MLALAQEPRHEVTLPVHRDLTVGELRQLFVQRLGMQPWLVLARLQDTSSRGLSQYEPLAADAMLETLGNPVYVDAVSSLGSA